MLQRRSFLREDCFNRGTQFRVGIFQPHAALCRRQLHHGIVQVLQLPPAFGSHGTGMSNRNAVSERTPNAEATSSLQS